MNPHLTRGSKNPVPGNTCRPMSATLRHVSGCCSFCLSLRWSNYYTKKPAIANGSASAGERTTLKYC